MPVPRNPLRRPVTAVAAVAAVLTSLAVTQAGLPAASAAPAAPAAPADAVVGELTRVVADPAPPADPGAAAAHVDDAETTTYVVPESGAPVAVTGEELEEVPSGADVEVTLGAQVPAAAGTGPVHDVTDVEVLDAPETTTSAATTGVTNPVTVVMATPPGVARDSTSLSSVVAAVNGPVARYWSAQSGGRVRFGVTAQHGWRALRNGCSNPLALWREVADSIGWVATGRNHLLVYLPEQAYTSAGCSYGMGTIGPGGAYSYVTALTLGDIGHELGHNLGLMHASLYRCQKGIDPPPGTNTTCEGISYFDLYDVMGLDWGSYGSINTVQRDSVGLLPAARRVDLTADSAPRDLTLAPVSAASGVIAVRITSGGTRYYLEYRGASGQDAWLAGGSSTNWWGLQAGVTVRKAGTRSLGHGSYLLDPTPSAFTPYTLDDLETAFPVGRAVTLPGGSTVTVRSVSASGAVVRVTPPVTPISTKYAALRGAAGTLGSPTSAEACGLPGGGCRRSYQHGWIYWSPSTGAHPLLGATLTRWLALGGAGGRLGYPTADPTCGAAAVGCQQSFQRGRLLRDPATGTWISSGPLITKWTALGGGSSALGHPVGDQVCNTTGTVCRQQFQRGWLYWTSVAGARPLSGAILAKWQQLGGASRLGYPIGDPYRSNGVLAQRFQKGTLTG
ncbi:LGFP repeat-containing protein [Geodermatophilus sp. SYSU D00697]